MNDQLLQLFTQQMSNSQSPEVSALMMQLLQEKQQSSSNDQSHSNTNKLQKRLLHAKKVISAQRSQLEIAAQFIEQFADLTGACDTCLGQVEACPHCHGKGGPGSRQPDMRLLEWIEPALKLLQVTSRELPKHPQNYPIEQGERK